MSLPGFVPPAAQMSADTAEKIKKAELLRKVNVMRSAIANRNDSEVDGNKEMSYCWVFDDPRETSRYEGMGYEIVRGTNGKEVKSRWRRQDGTHKRGDSILMQCQKDMREAWEWDAAIRGVEQVSGAKAQFVEFAQEEKIPTFNKQ